MSTLNFNPGSHRPRRFSKLSFPAILTAAFLAPAPVVRGQGKSAPAAEPAYAPGEVLIKFKAGAENAKLLDAFQRGRLDKVKRSFKLKGGDHPGLHHITTTLDVPSAVLALSKHPAVEYVEPNYRIYPSAVPNDPQYPQLWSMPKISAPAAWDLTTGTTSVIVGVVDSGIDVNHPDLAANIWTNPAEVPNDGLDNDGNGYVDDVRGWDWWNGDNTVFDAGEISHGTHVAGTIGAAGGNGTGIAGLNWQARIIPLKFIGPEFGFNSGAIAAIEYAAAQGVKVLNGSFGSNVFGQGIHDAIDAAGILFVAAAGNYSSNTDTTPFYPAGFNLGNVISVAATDSNDLLASFSNYGAASVDLGAPGVSILSTLPGNQYGNMNGTSMAAPHVSGVAALVYSLHPGLSAAEVKYRILTSTDSVSSLSGKTVTGGRLNAAKAMLPPVPSSQVAADGFESNNFTGGTGSWAGGWTNSGDISIRTQDGPAEGSRHVRLRRGTGYLRRSANVGGASDLCLSFKSKVSSFEGSDVADVLVSSDGTTWIPALHLTAADSDNQYHDYEIELVSGPLGHIHIAFDAGMSAQDDNWYLDDIRITGAPGNLPPVADAGPNRFATDTDGNGSERLTLNGGNSFDPDGTIVSYQWTVNGTPLGDTPVLDVEVPAGSTWNATLTVTDNNNFSRSDPVQLTVNAGAAEVFYDGFERTSLAPWTQDSQYDWFSSTQRSSGSGARSAEVDGSASDAQLVSPVINLQGRVYATVTFDWMIESSLDSGEYLAFDLSQDGGATWIERQRINGNVDAEDAWRSMVFVPSVPNGTLRLRFRGKMNSSDEDAFVDNIRVVAE
ncbi:MAG: S8 family serine peptidase [Verrucomicrobiales bacterium]